MRDLDDDGPFHGPRSFDRARARARAQHENHLHLSASDLLSQSERRKAKGCLTAFAGVWLVSILASLGMLGLFVWGLISLIHYLDRH